MEGIDVDGTTIQNSIKITVSFILQALYISRISLIILFHIAFEQNVSEKHEYDQYELFTKNDIQS